MRLKFGLFISLFILTYFSLNAVSTAQSAAPLPASAASSAAAALSWDSPFRLCWSFSIPEINSLSPATDHKKKIFLPLSEGGLLALDADSGKIVWRSSLGGAVFSQPISDRDRLFLLNRVSDHSGTEFVLRAISSATGLTLWQRSLEFPAEPAEIFLAVDNETLLLVVDNGRLLAFQNANGTDLWHRELPAGINAEPLISNNAVVIGRKDGRVSVIDAKTGADVFEYNFARLNGAENTVLAKNGARIFYGNRAGGIYSFRQSDQKLLWRARAGGQIASMAFVKDNLLVSSLDGFVYLLDSETGNRLWKKRFSGRPLGKTLLLDDNHALVLTIDGNAAQILEILSGKVVNQIFLEEGLTVAGEAVLAGRKVLIPTVRGLSAYSADCSAQ
jgi:outer membrane protein assembly factor BamB